MGGAEHVSAPWSARNSVPYRCAMTWSATGVIAPCCDSSRKSCSMPEGADIHTIWSTPVPVFRRLCHAPLGMEMVTPGTTVFVMSSTVARPWPLCTNQTSSHWRCRCVSIAWPDGSICIPTAKALCGGCGLTSRVMSPRSGGPNFSRSPSPASQMFIVTDQRVAHAPCAVKSSESLDRTSLSGTGNISPKRRASRVPPHQ